MGSRRGEGGQVQVDSYRGHNILLDKETSKFLIEEIGDAAPMDSVQAAKNAIDRHLTGLNKGVRRKVLFFKGRHYRGDDEERRQIAEGELTSWTRPRGWRARIEGVVMVDGDRQNMLQDDIFEDTPENRVIMEKVLKTDERYRRAKTEGDNLIKELKRAALPDHLKKAEE